MKRIKTDTMFVVDKNGRLFVDARCVAPLMILMFDAISLAVWPDEPNRPYMLVEDAIAWSEREERSVSSKQRKDTTAALKMTLEKYKTGKFVFTDEPDTARAATDAIEKEDA